MGFFSSVNKSLGLGKNNDLLRIGAAVGTGGMSELALAAKGENGGLNDILLGKKGGGTKADSIAAQIKATQTKGLGELNSALNTPADSIVREQATREKTGVLSAAQDARRNAQANMARAGLKNTSLAAASERSLTQSTGKQLATIDARIPGAIRSQQLADAQTRIGAGGLAGASNIQFQDIAAKRSGGLLGIASSLAPLAGTIAGGMTGGQIGSGLSGVMQPQQGQAYNSNNYSMGNYNF